MDNLITTCETIYSLRLQKKQLEEQLAALEKEVKGYMAEQGKDDETAGRFIIHIKRTPPTQIVDTAKLKAAGLFETYSKTRAGSESVMITESK